MSSLEAFDAIKGRITEVWADETPVVYENEAFPTPNKPAPFLYVEIFGTSYEQASLGADPQSQNKWRENGLLLLHMMVPNGSGTSQARIYAKQLAAMFRGQEVSGVVFRDMSIGASEPGDEDGNYYRMTVRVDWQRDE